MSVAMVMFRERDRGRFDDTYRTKGLKFRTEEEVWSWWDKWEADGCQMYYRHPVRNEVDEVPTNQCTS